jgi:protein-tyrosine phosphatase
MVVEIISGLYLGNKRDAYNAGFLKMRRIDIIINTTNEVEFMNGCIKSGIQCIRVDISDQHTDENRMKHNRDYYYQLGSLCSLIDKNLERNKNILVHCRHGKYRSTCLIIAYILYKTRMKLEEVYELISYKYPLVKLKNHLFFNALKMFEEEMLNN